MMRSSFAICCTLGMTLGACGSDDDGGAGSSGAGAAGAAASHGTGGSAGSAAGGASAGGTGGSAATGGAAGSGASGGSAGGGSGGEAGAAGAGNPGTCGTPAAGSGVFYVDPAAGSASGDGSAERPWRTVQEVAEAGLLGTSVQPGDTVLLRSGYHGELMLGSGSFAPPITLAADAGHRPELRRVRASNVSGLVLCGLSISPSHAATYATLTMVDFQATSQNIRLENSTLYSVSDASAWTATDWVDRASSGVQVSGPDITLRNNTIRNVRFGISVSGDNALVDGNTIENFSADGLRGLGDYGTFQYNVVKNAYADGSVDDNHDDGFQSWSVGPGGVGTGEVRGIVLRGNTFLNFESESQPLRATLQGIGCFDGLFVDWVVENNVVVTDHWHGISLYGARDSRIVNNTVIDNASGQPGPPWIMVTAHKDGRASQNVVVRNNLATDFSIEGTNVTQDHNVELTNLGTFFVNAAAFDLHLRAGAPAIDAGSSLLAPALDRDGVMRPQGAGIDLGAYEYR